MTADGNVKLYGTADAPEALKPVRQGSLSFLYSAEAIRRICWHETELVRAVAWPVRDKNWGTYSPVILEEKLEDNGASFSGLLKFSVDDGRLDCALSIKASDAGDLRLDLTMTPTKSPFATNRAGFTVLHPIKGIAGAPLQVTHSNGEVEQTEFPRPIAPGQPVFDIQGLTYKLHGKTADIAFAGDIFEMEDQRNWSDASYKTYCVPLVFPFTYEIDGPKTQTISISLSGAATSDAETQNAMALTVRKSTEIAPEIGLAVEPGWLGDGNTITQSGVRHIRARLGPEMADEDLERLASVAQGLELEIELVIADAEDPESALANAGKKLKGAGLAVSRITALREGYLASYQPSGPWPEGPDPGVVVAASRAGFPDAEIGGGMLTNFTEYNRCRPDPALCDFVTHGSTAIVHAADDLSVCETLEALPQIFESARSIADGKPYRPGLISIGMRSNPYGAAVAENSAQFRRTMAREDPRQRGLFAAAWAVGVLAATAGQQVDALCLAAPTGPFGIAYREQRYPQAYFDETPDAAFYPIFHVVKMAAAMTGRARLRLSGLPEGVHVYGVETATGTSLMVANVTPDARPVRFDRPGRIAVLDTTTFTNATRQVDWLETAPRQTSAQLMLEPFAVAFVEN